MTGNPTAGWSSALDQFEARLEQFRSVLAEKGQPAKGVWPPADIVGVPLPPELADRARKLLEQARDLEGQLVARRSELPAKRNAVRHRKRPASTIYAEL